MFIKHEGSETRVIGDDGCQMTVHIPPTGMVYNWQKKKLEAGDVICRSAIEEEQYWERPEPPEDWDDKRRLEKIAQKTDPKYVDPDLEEYRAREWRRRLFGCWFMNNGKMVYLTGIHYFFLSHWTLDIGYPDFRMPDLEFFYAWDYIAQDDNSAGLILLTKRRQGKTAKSGAIIYDRTSRTHKALGGIQSKTEKDAKDVVFFNGVVQSFIYMIDFFVPKFDRGKVFPPTDKLRFFPTGLKGNKTEEFVIKKGDYLESSIDYKNSGEKAYDGSKLYTYIGDEVAKCLKKDTLVRMLDGYTKAVQDIKTGDKLIGIDSSERVVKSVTTGEEECYDIIPKKGEKWGCNKSHILSLKYCRSERPLYINGNKYEKEDTVNISVEDFIKLPKSTQKHLMLYRVGVEYPEQQHDLDPYLLGLWLGDGNSANFKFTVDDQEIKDYLSDYADKNQLEYVEKVYSNKTPSCYLLDKSGHYPFNMKRLGLFKNKHIPNNYLIDSRKNRLKLLAGLIDTDGYGARRRYEITQKRKDLAKGVHELALSLGFFASFKEKVATMKRADGSVYKCPVYRVTIFGNELHEIPCLVERKRMFKIDNPHKNTRNPARCGFKVVPTGVEQYYGFTIDDDHLFLLGDYTVTHNTEAVDVHKRHYIIRKTLLGRDQYSILGKALYTTTIEEMNAGSSQFIELWDESDQSNLNANKRTKSWLYRWFVPAHKTLFFDRYGYADEKRAIESLHNERESLRESPHALASEIRQNPMTWREAFRSDGETCLYNPLILDDRLDHLKWIKGAYKTGSLRWEDNEKKEKVIFVPNPKGRFMIYEEPENPNNVKFPRSDRTSPASPLRYVIGVDPFDHDRTKNGRFSMGAAAVYKRYDSLNKTGDNFVALYKGRPPHPYMFYEDMVLLSHWYGCWILYEDQKTGIKRYFEDKNRMDFLMRNDKGEVGISASTGAHIDIVEETTIFIEQHGSRVMFQDLLTDWRNFDVNNTEEFDLGMASGYALIANSRIKRGNEKRLSIRTKNIGTLFKQHTIIKRR